MSRAYLALGANIGAPAKQLKEAVRRIAEHSGIHVVRRSQVIETEPWGKTDQPKFLNMAIEIETSLPPLDLMQACLMIERDMGRVRGEKWGPRVIDIDIIAYGHTRLVTPALTLPHPHAYEREFVLAPLREIAPEVAAWVEDVASSSPPRPSPQGGG
ncbi:MAG: 2-amino-4-hydroxy-6-hydroxymethyldihydropteridine diphosphokinase [Cucumibacter sp.]